MAELADLTKKMGYKLEQVQDFTPTPMTTATEMYYTGYDPYTMEPVFTAKTQKEKLAQRQYFFWYKDTPQSSRKANQQSSRKDCKQKKSYNPNFFSGSRVVSRPTDASGKRKKGKK